MRLLSSTFAVRVALGVLLGMPAAVTWADEKAHPKTDAFGDPLPVGASARLGTVRLRHADYLMHVTFAPDGKTLISTGTDGVRVWETATGRPLRHFGAGVLPSSVAVSLDGSRIAVSRHHAGTGGPIDVWDVPTGKLLHKMGDQHYTHVRFAPDGKRLAALASLGFPLVDHPPPCRVEIWDVRTGRRLHVWDGPKQYVADLRFSADGKTLYLAGYPRTILIRDAASGKEVRRFHDLPCHVDTLLVSPDGRRLAFLELIVDKQPGSVMWGRGERAFVIDAQTGAEVRHWSVKKQPGQTNSLFGAAFTPDGKKLAACASTGPVLLWDVQSGEEKQLMPDGWSHSGGLAFSRDGRTLAVGNGGRAIRLLDAASGADRVPPQGHQGEVTALAVAADGRMAFTAEGAGIIHRWDVRTGRARAHLKGHAKEVTALALSASGDLFSSDADNKLLRWDARTSKSRSLIEESNPSWRSRLRLSSDGKTLAVAGLHSKRLLLLDTANGKCLHRLTTKWRIIDVAFAADGSSLVALLGDRTLCRWRLPAATRLPDAVMSFDAEEPRPGHPDSHYQGEHIVFAPDGSLAAHAFDAHFLRLVDLTRQRQVRRSAKLPKPVSTLAFAADGRTLAWAEESGVIHWLELATWSERRKLSGHAGAVKQIVFTADGKRLLSASTDTTVLVWELLGDGAARLTADERAACWPLLADGDAAKAYDAVCRLVAAPADALALLRERLQPSKGVEAKSIERLIADLDSGEFAVREQAAERLRKLGELAEPALSKALASRPSLEMRRRISELLDDAAERRWHPPAETLRQLRAVEVLERIGTPDAKNLLQTLANGAPGGRLTREARAAVERLKAHQGAKP